MGKDNKQTPNPLSGLMEEINRLSAVKDRVALEKNIQALPTPPPLFTCVTLTPKKVQVIVEEKEFSFIPQKCEWRITADRVIARVKGFDKDNAPRKRDFDITAGENRPEWLIVPRFVEEMRGILAGFNKQNVLGEKKC